MPGQVKWRPCGLRCDGKINPVGVPGAIPRLRWRLPEAAGDDRQSAYQVIVASSAARLGDAVDVWDSGWVSSGELSHPYGGRPTLSRERLWWAVRVQTTSGEVSGWSEAAWWEAGLLRRSDWRASWIRAPHNELAATERCGHLIRRIFSLEAAAVRARAYISALGAYELWINGEVFGDEFLRPGWTDYNRRLQYQVVDVTEQLRVGGNVIGAVLAPGWFGGRISSYPAATREHHRDVRPSQLLLQLEVQDADGMQTTVLTDEAWQSCASAILSSDLYDGEVWDRRLVRAGWAGGQAYDPGAWEPVELSTGTAAPLVSGRGPSLRAIDVQPALVHWRADGSALVDSGRNDTGYLRLKVQAARGQRVDVIYGEILDPNGNLYRENLRGARCTDSFICAGEGEEDLAPSFSCRGYRYAEVRGLSDRKGLLGAEAVTIGSEMERVGWFHCSEQLLEQTYEMIVCSLRANYVEVPTDCPQRDERLGWMADALLFAPVAAYTYDISSFMSKWFDDVLDARSPAGGFSDIAPRPSARWHGRTPVGSPAWADAGVLLPWLIYERYGDREVLERMFPAMCSWLGLVHRANPDGIWHNERGADYGDWVPVGPDTSHDLFSTCWLYRSTVVACQIAELLGDSAVAGWLGDRAKIVREAFASRFVEASSGRVIDPEPSGSSAAARRFAPVLADETQTGYVMALSHGLLEGKLAEKAGRHLRDLVVGAGGRLQTGFAGSAFLPSALERAGFPGLAYDLFLQTDPPSLGFMVKSGSTSVWERWDGIGPDGWPACPVMNSFNHYAMGSMTSWLVEGVCGLRPTAGVPALKSFRFAPALSRRVHDSAFELRSPFGDIAVHWSWDGHDRAVGAVKVPPGAICSIARIVSVDDDLVGGRVLDKNQGSTSADLVMSSGEHEVVWVCQS